MCRIKAVLCCREDEGLLTVGHQCSKNVQLFLIWRKRQKGFFMPKQKKNYNYQDALRLLPYKATPTAFHPERWSANL